MNVSNNPPLRLDTLAIVDVSGADAESFLQGQFCNDIAGIPMPGSQLTGYCSPKGRLLAALLLQRLPEAFRLILPADLLNTFLVRVRMFVMRADVTFTHRDDLTAVGLFDAADPLLQTRGLVATADALGVAVSGDNSVARWPDDQLQRWVMILAKSAISSDMADGSERWRLADIRAGLPSVVDATREAFVPQMMNFSEVQGLSFTKGCYPGQEIVARTQYLGKLKKHMRRFVADAGELPLPGQVLGEAGSTEAGEVVDAVQREDGGLELLAVVRIAREEGATLPLVGGAAHLADLPYTPPGSAAESETG